MDKERERERDREGGRRAGRVSVTRGEGKASARASAYLEAVARALLPELAVLGAVDGVDPGRGHENHGGSKAGIEGVVASQADALHRVLGLLDQEQALPVLGRVIVQVAAAGLALEVGAGIAGRASRRMRRVVRSRHCRISGEGARGGRERRQLVDSTWMAKRLSNPSFFRSNPSFFRVFFFREKLARDSFVPITDRTQPPPWWLRQRRHTHLLLLQSKFRNCESMERLFLPPRTQPDLAGINGLVDLSVPSLTFLGTLLLMISSISSTPKF